jgi:hypothetical protein
MNAPAGQAPATRAFPEANREEAPVDPRRTRIIARILRGQGWMRSPYRGVWRDADELRKLAEKRGAK